MRTALLSSGLTLLLTVQGAAAADTFRCDRKLVSIGDSRYEVKTSCGDPDDELQRTEERTVTTQRRVPCGPNDKGRSCWRTVSRTIEVTVDEWLYDFGSLQFIKHLTFEQGKLVKIVDGERGRKH